MISTTELQPATNNIVAHATQRRGEDQIRERLLNKLGIFLDQNPTAGPKSNNCVSPVPDDATTKKHSSPMTKKDCVRSPPPPPTPSSSPLGSGDPKNPLDPHSSIPGAGAGAGGSCFLLDYSTQRSEPLYLHPQLLYQREKSLQFFPLTNVVEIPSHRDYSDEDYNRMWNSSHHIQLNRERSVMEFEADQYDWRKATEEGSFIAIDGELHHPATFTVLRTAEQHHIKTTMMMIRDSSSTMKNRKTKRRKKRKKKRGNIPSKSVQQGPGGGRGTTTRSAKPAMASLTRFADT